MNAHLFPTGQRALEGALPLDGREETAPLAVGLAGRKRKVRTTQHAKDDFAVLDQGQRHRVLIQPQKTLGPVDGVQGPEAPRGAPFVGPRVDEVEHIPGAQPRNGFAHVGHHLFGQLAIGGLAQGRGVLLAHQRNIGKCAAQDMGDHRLSAEIRHGHRRFVTLVHGGLGHQVGLNLPAQATGRFHGLYGNAALFGMRHPSCLAKGHGRGKRGQNPGRRDGLIAPRKPANPAIRSGPRPSEKYAPHRQAP